MKDQGKTHEYHCEEEIVQTSQVDVRVGMGTGRIRWGEGGGQEFSEHTFSKERTVVLSRCLERHGSDNLMVAQIQLEVFLKASFYCFQSVTFSFLNTSN